MRRLQELRDRLNASFDRVLNSQHEEERSGDIAATVSIVVPQDLEPPQFIQTLRDRVPNIPEEFELCRLLGQQRRFIQLDDFCPRQIRGRNVLGRSNLYICPKETQSSSRQTAMISVLLMVGLQSSYGGFEGRPGNMIFTYDQRALLANKYYTAGKLVAWSIMHNGPGPRLNYTSFEALVLTLSHPTCKSQQPTLLVVVYRAPGPYTDFLSDFAEFLCSLVLKSASVIVMGDFNIHVDNECDSLSRAFLSLLESVGFSQCVHEPSHCFLHTLDLVLSYGVEINNLTVFPQNPLLSNHALITFDFLLLDDPPSAKSVYTRHLSDQTVSQFKEEILSVFSSVPCLNVAVDPFSDVNSSPAQIDQIVECAAGSVRNIELIGCVKQKAELINICKNGVIRSVL
ncbi:uncharacterized protein V6R79_001338 [Siganus canaliculatus]